MVHVVNARPQVKLLLWILRCFDLNASNNRSARLVPGCRTSALVYSVIVKGRILRFGWPTLQDEHRTISQNPRHDIKGAFPYFKGFFFGIIIYLKNAFFRVNPIKKG